MKHGLAGFADYEVIELLLTLAIPRSDVKQPAKALMDRFRNLRGILDAPLEALQEEYGISGAPTHEVRLHDLGLYRGERFRYVYDFGAYWECDLRLEALLPLVPRRVYPVCTGGKRAAPPEDCQGAWGYLERLDQHRLYPPLATMGVVAEALTTL
jgi:hypothetical protein